MTGDPWAFMGMDFYVDENLIVDGNYISDGENNYLISDLNISGISWVDANSVYVPYDGATRDVNIGQNSLLVWQIKDLMDRRNIVLTTRMLYDEDENYALNWQTRSLIDDDEIISLMWDSRFLINDDGDIVAKWTDEFELVENMDASGNSIYAAMDVNATQFMKAGCYYFLDGTHFCSLGDMNAGVDLTGYVPYIGATTDLNLGLHNLDVNNINIGTPAGTDPRITFLSDGAYGIFWWEDVGDRFNFDHGIDVDGTIAADEFVGPSIRWATGDYLTFNRTDNNWGFLINNEQVVEIDSTGNVWVGGTLDVDSNITANCYILNDGNYFCNLDDLHLEIIPDTNWETSWTVFDANMNATYTRLGDTNVWINQLLLPYLTKTDANMFYALKDDVNIWIDQKIALVSGLVDTNWVTSWATFDANMKATYYTQDQLNSPSGSGLIGIPIIGTPTWTDQNDFDNLFGSTGRATGGTISEAGGVITIAAGTGFIKATDSDTAELLSFDWAEETGFSVATNTIKYFGIEYNGGSPQVMETTSEGDFDFDTSFPLGQVINQADEYYVLQNPWWVTDGMTNIIERFGSFGHLQRDAEVGGLIPGYSGVRYLTMSGGRIWGRLLEHNIANFTTVGDVDDFDMYYRDSATTWAEVELYQWNNTQYNPITGVNAYTLQTISNNQYSVIWVWVNASSQKPSLMFPQQTYPSVAAAEAEIVPDFPAMWYKGGIIIGRFIVKQGVDDPIEVQTAFDTMFSAALAADHGNLAGLSDDDHTQYLLANGSRVLTGDWNAGDYNIKAKYFIGNGSLLTGITFTDTNFQTAGYGDLNMDLNYLQVGDNVSELENDAGYLTSYLDTNFQTAGMSVADINNLWKASGTDIYNLNSGNVSLTGNLTLAQSKYIYLDGANNRIISDGDDYVGIYGNAGAKLGSVSGGADSTIFEVIEGTGSKATGDLEATGNLKVAGIIHPTGIQQTTIASGAITITGNVVSVDTESAAATDDLTTINGGKAGQILVIKATLVGKTVVCKDGTGNLRLNGDMTLNHQQDTLTLLESTDGGNWFEISRSNNS